MKALMCHELGGPEQLVLEEVDDPKPATGEVVVDIHAAGINFPDVLIIKGKYQAKPELPFTPGGEAAGVVSALGDGVDDLKIGDRVIVCTLTGGFATKTVVKRSVVAPMPEAMDFITGAGFTITYGTSYYALKQRAKIQPGETLLVLGAAGGVGLAAVELGKVMGAQVIACASTDAKLETCRAAGADELINYETEDLKARLKELTNGKGVDVVYDPVGGPYSEIALRATGWEGRYLVIGFAAGDIPKIPLNLTLLKGSQIVGVFWGAWVSRDPRGHVANFRELFEMYGDRRIKPLISEVYSLDDYQAAFDCLLGRRARGKVILKTR